MEGNNERSANAKLFIITPQELAELGVLNNLPNIKFNKKDEKPVPTTSTSFDKLDTITVLKNAIQKKMSSNDKLVFKKPVEPGSSKVKKIHSEKLSGEIELLNPDNKPTKKVKYNKKKDTVGKRDPVPKIKNKSISKIKPDKNLSKSADTFKRKKVSILSDTQVKFSPDDLKKIISEIPNVNNTSASESKDVIVGTNQINNDFRKPKIIRKIKPIPNIGGLKRKRAVANMENTSSDNMLYSLDEVEQKNDNEVIKTDSNDSNFVKSLNNTSMNITTDVGTNKYFNNNIEDIRANDHFKEEPNHSKTIDTETVVNYEDVEGCGAKKKQGRNQKINESSINNPQETVLAREDDNAIECAENMLGILQNENSLNMLKRQSGTLINEEVKVGLRYDVLSQGTQEQPLTDEIPINCMKTGTFENKEESVDFDESKKIKITSNIELQGTYLQNIGSGVNMNEGGAQTRIKLGTKVKNKPRLSSTTSSRNNSKEIIKKEITHVKSTQKQCHKQLLVDESPMHCQKTIDTSENTLDNDRETVTFVGSTDTTPSTTVISIEDQRSYQLDVTENERDASSKNDLVAPKLVSNLKEISKEEISLKLSKGTSETGEISTFINEEIKVGLTQDVLTQQSLDQPSTDEIPIKCMKTCTFKDTLENKEERFDVDESKKEKKSINIDTQGSSVNKKDRGAKTSKKLDTTEKNKPRLSNTTSSRNSSKERINRKIIKVKSNQEQPHKQLLIDEPRTHCKIGTSEDTFESKVQTEAVLSTITPLSSVIRNEDQGSYQLDVPENERDTISKNDLVAPKLVSNLKEINKEEISLKLSKGTSEMGEISTLINEELKVGLTEDVLTQGSIEQPSTDEIPIKCMKTGTFNDTFENKKESVYIDENKKEKNTSNIEIQGCNISSFVNKKERGTKTRKKLDTKEKNKPRLSSTTSSRNKSKESINREIIKVKRDREQPHKQLLIDEPQTHSKKTIGNSEDMFESKIQTETILNTITPLSSVIRNADQGSYQLEFSENERGTSSKNDLVAPKLISSLKEINKEEISLKLSKGTSEMGEISTLINEKLKVGLTEDDYLSQGTLEQSSTDETTIKCMKTGTAKDFLENKEESFDDDESKKEKKSINIGTQGSCINKKEKGAKTRKKLDTKEKNKPRLSSTTSNRKNSKESINKQIIKVKRDQEQPHKQLLIDEPQTHSKKTIGTSEDTFENKAQTETILSSITPLSSVIRNEDQGSYQLDFPENERDTSSKNDLVAPLLVSNLKEISKEEISQKLSKGTSEMGKISTLVNEELKVGLTEDYLSQGTLEQSSTDETTIKCMKTGTAKDFLENTEESLIVDENKKEKKSINIDTQGSCINKKERGAKTRKKLDTTEKNKPRLSSTTSSRNNSKERINRNIIKVKGNQEQPHKQLLIDEPQTQCKISTSEDTFENKVQTETVLSTITPSNTVTSIEDQGSYQLDLPENERGTNSKNDLVATKLVRSLKEISKPEVTNKDYELCSEKKSEQSINKEIKEVKNDLTIEKQDILKNKSEEIKNSDLQLSIEKPKDDASKKFSNSQSPKNVDNIVSKTTDALVKKKGGRPKKHSINPSTCTEGISVQENMLSVSISSKGNKSKRSSISRTDKYLNTCTSINPNEPDTVPNIESKMNEQSQVHPTDKLYDSNSEESSNNNNTSIVSSLEQNQSINDTKNPVSQSISESSMKENDDKLDITPIVVNCKNDEIPKKKRGRKPKSERVPSPVNEKIELPTEISRSGRKRLKINYAEMENLNENVQMNRKRKREIENEKDVETLCESTPAKKRGRKSNLYTGTSQNGSKHDKLIEETSIESDHTPKSVAHEKLENNSVDFTTPKKKRGRKPKSERLQPPLDDVEINIKSECRDGLYLEQEKNSNLGKKKQNRKSKSPLTQSPIEENIEVGEIDQINKKSEETTIDTENVEAKVPESPVADRNDESVRSSSTPKGTNIVDISASKPVVGRGRPKKIPVYSDDVNNDGDVICVICNKEVGSGEWKDHNEIVHNNLGWRQGEPDLRLDDDALLKNILNPLLAKSKRLICFKCKTSYTKRMDFILHKEECDGISCNGNVTCAICNNLVVRKQWTKHKLQHNNLAWRVGDAPLDLNNETLVIQILTSLYKAKKPLQCEKCKTRKKSVLGFLSHRGQCGLTLSEAQIPCDICGKKCLPSSMPTHMKQHNNDKENITKKLKSDFFEIDIDASLGKRRAATKALTLLDTLSKGDKLEHFRFYVKQMNFDENKELVVFLNNELEENKSLTCKITGCEFNTTETVSLLLEHMIACPLKPDEYYACNKCYSICPTEDAMIQHLKLVHDREVKPDVDYEQQNNASDEEDVENENPPTTRVPETRTVFKARKDNQNNPTPLFVLVTSRKNTNKLSLYSHAFEYTFEFCQTHFTSRNLFENLYPKELYLLEEHIEPYMPPSDVSCDVAKKIVKGFENVYSAEYNFKNFELFETEMGDATVTIYCGGPVHSLSWLPTPYTSLNELQILAVAIGQDFNGIYRVDNNYSERTLIQFWNFGILKNRQNFQIPTFELGIIFDNGPIWHMEWCPTGCFNPENSEKGSRMGLLAVAGSMMTVNVYSIPFLKEEQKGLFYKLNPVLKLQLVAKESELKRTIFATKISWSKVSGCTSIAVGYSDGSVGIYNLNVTSNLIKFKDQNSIDVLLPYKVIKAHTHFISVLSWIPIEGDRLLMTGSYDKNMFVWDLLTGHRFATKKNKILTDGTWLTNWLSVATANEEATLANGLVTMTQHCHREYLNENSQVSYSTGTISSLSASDWLNGFVHANTVGEVVGSFPHQMLFCQDLLKRGLSYRCLLGYTKLIDKTKSPEERAIVEKKKHEFLKPVPRKRASYTAKDFVRGKEPYDIYEPLQYQESIDQYGVLFCDIKPGHTHTLKLNSGQSEYSKPNLYPLQGINKISFNPNRQATLYYAAGYQIGFIRVTYIKSLDTDTQIDKSENS